ncbi:protein kinase domain-containing protein [Xanthobacteraceae bacterium A53D]
MPSRAMSDLFEAFGTLHRSLADLPEAADREIARDAVRDALDRDAAEVSASALDADLGVPRIIAGTWHVEDVLHRGAHTLLLRLRHRDLGLKQALKTLQPDQGSDPVLRRLLLREGAHQLRVRHPAVVAAHAVLRLPDGRPALLMDLHDAPSLPAARAPRAFTPAEVLALGLRLSAALEAVHAAGLLHLDLTPANVLLPDGDPARAMLCDLGLSLAPGDCRAMDELAYAATPGWCAPEQEFRDQPLDARTDLYALGRLLTYALEGVSAHPLTLALGRLAGELGRPRPAERPGSVADVSARLLQLAGEAGGAQQG